MIVLPTSGERLDLLRRALESCIGIESSVLGPVVVVAPSSAKAAGKLARSYGAVVVRDAGKGISQATNTGLSQTSSEKYYVWLGDDDELVAEGVNHLLEKLAQNPDAVLAYGYCEYINEAGRVVAKSKAGPIAKSLLSWGPNLIPHPGTVIRVEAMRAVGCFDPGLKFALDLDLFLKLRKLGTFISLPIVSARFRWHADSTTVADRSSSTREAIIVKNRHLPAWLRPLSWIWNYPVAWASQVAAWAATLRARNLSV